MKRPAITPAMRLAVLKAHKATVMCSECGKDVSVADVQIDHHLALVDGGAHDVDNLRPLCPDPCHRIKSAREHVANCKAKRLLKKHSNPTPQGTMKSAGFNKAWTKKMDGTVIRRDSK